LEASSAILEEGSYAGPNVMEYISPAL